jgi:hypothetical protein
MMSGIDVPLRGIDLIGAWTQDFGPDTIRVDMSQRRHAAHESNDFSPKATHAVRVQIVNGATVEC